MHAQTMFLSDLGLNFFQIMLNRRLLRVKAFKALYAYKQVSQTNYHLAETQIISAFANQVLTATPETEEALEEKRQKSIAILGEINKDEKKLFNTESNKKIILEAERAFKFFIQTNLSDKNLLLKNLTFKTELIFSYYIQIISILIDIAEASDVEKVENGNKKLDTNKLPEVYFQFGKNLVISKLKKSKELQNLFQEHKNSISFDELRMLVIKNLHSDKVFLEYIKNGVFDFEQDKKLVLHVFKNILKGMVADTLKSVNDENDEIEISPISQDWTNDKQFMLDLFEHSVNQFDKYQKIVSSHTQNWDEERIALTDIIILVMAISEMVYFSAIPIKVTLNEFLELSKSYSTPKSHIFINGVLDKLIEELKTKGIIKKSGRGLIDN